MEEVWKDIPNYKDRYIVSNLGRVYSYLSNKILKTHISTNGYEQLTLVASNGERVKHRVHRLVAMAFLPNPDNLPEVNHKDENKLNNCVDNLEWCTKTYNNNYGTKTSKNKNHTYKPKVQLTKEKHENPKEDIVAIYLTAEAFDTNGFRRSPCNAVARGDKHYHTAFGYRWAHAKVIEIGGDE